MQTVNREGKNSLEPFSKELKVVLLSSIKTVVSHLKLKIEGQTIYRKPQAAKLQNSNQNSTLSWVSLIGLQELRF